MSCSGDSIVDSITEYQGVLVFGSNIVFIVLFAKTIIFKFSSLLTYCSFLVFVTFFLFCALGVVQEPNPYNVASKTVYYVLTAENVY